jgi:antitoxin CptB
MAAPTDAPEPGPEETVFPGPESREIRERRLRLRSWRRGIREMDLILGGFADARLPELTEAELAQYDALLSENDQDLYAWVSGREEAPEGHAPILARVAAHLATDPAGQGAGPR